MSKRQTNGRARWAQVASKRFVWPTCPPYMAGPFRGPAGCPQGNVPPPLWQVREDRDALQTELETTYSKLTEKSRKLSHMEHDPIYRTAENLKTENGILKAQLEEKQREVCLHGEQGSGERVGGRTSTPNTGWGWGAGLRERGCYERAYIEGGPEGWRLFGNGPKICPPWTMTCPSK